MNAIAPSLTGNPVTLLVLGIAFLALLFAGIVFDVILMVRAWRGNPLLFNLRIDSVKARPWTASDAAAIFLLVVSLNIWMGLTLSAIRQIGGWPSDRLIHPALVVQTLGVPLAAVAICVAVMRRRRLSWREAFGLHSRHWPRQVLDGIFCYVATVPVVLLASVVYIGALMRLGYPVESQDVIRLLADPSQPLWLQLYIAVLAVTLAPFAEELLFRGIILPGVLKHASPRSALVLVALLFSVLHLHVPSVVPLFVLAMALSLAYIETGSLLVSMVMHTLFNGVSLAVLAAVRDMLPVTATH